MSERYLIPCYVIPFVFFLFFTQSFNYYWFTVFKEYIGRKKGAQDGLEPRDRVLYVYKFQTNKRGITITNTNTTYYHPEVDKTKDTISLYRLAFKRYVEISVCRYIYPCWISKQSFIYTFQKLQKTEKKDSKY